MLGYTRNLEETFSYLAFYWHQVVNDQRRKYTNELYIAHPKRVAEMYIRHFVLDDAGIAAAYIHDVLEDTEATVSELQKQARLLMGKHFDLDKVGLVLSVAQELTSHFSKEMFPQLSRHERKRREAERLRGISERATNIKLIDIIDNSLNIATHDPHFASVYLREQQMKLQALTHGYSYLHNFATQVVRQEKLKLGID